MSRAESIQTRFVEQPTPRLEQTLDDGTMVAIEPWPARARRRFGDRWQQYTPSLCLSAVRGGIGGYQQLLDLFAEDLDDRETEVAREMRAWHAFIEHIPGDVCGELIRRYESDHFPLLAFLSRCSHLGYALDLVRSNPPLAYLLARAGSLAPAAGVDPETVVRHKQTAALSMVLGRDATRSDVRVVRKLTRDALTVRGATLLLDLLRAPSPTRRWLRHLPSINGLVLEVLADERCRPHVAYSLLVELSRLGGEARQARSMLALLRDTIRQAELLGRATPGFVLSDLRELREVHDDLAWETHELRELRRYRFPAPPFAGTDVVVATTTPSILQDAARRCRNCAAIYAPQIARGTAFVYEVRIPDATRPGMIRIEQSGRRWSLVEHEAFANRRPSAAAWTAVHDWAAQHGITTGRAPKEALAPSHAVEIVVEQGPSRAPMPQQLEAPGVGSLLRLLTDAATDVVSRRGAALACEHLSWARDEVVPALLGVLEADPDEEVRKHAARALARLADATAHGRIKRVLNATESSELRWEIATALYRIGPRR